MDVASTQPHRVERQTGMLNLRDILTLLFKYKLTIIAVSFLITLASLVLAFSQKLVYEAETSLLVKVGREHLFTSETNDSAPRMAIDVQTIVDPELTILASQDLRQRVIESIGVNRLYPDLVENSSENIDPMQAAMSRFQKNLGVYQEAKSNIIRVTFRHKEPNMTAKAVNTLAKFWKEKHLKIFSNPQAPFLQEQAENYRVRLEHTENQLQQFKQEYGISSFPKQKELLLEQRQKLDARLKAVQNEIQGLTTKISSLGQQMKTIPKEIPLSMVNAERNLIEETKRELLVLKRKEQELSGRYQDTARILVELRKEISLVQTFLDQQVDKLGDTVTTGRNPVYQQLELGLLSAKSQHASLQTQNKVTTQQFQSLNDQIGHLSQLQQRFDMLAREASKDQENLRRYVEKVEAAKITEEMDRQQIANVSVIQAATVPIRPVKSKKSIIVILGLILGVGTGIALAMVLEHLQMSYTRPEQVTYELGIPILASITNKP